MIGRALEPGVSKKAFSIRAIEPGGVVLTLRGQNKVFSRDFHKVTFLGYSHHRGHGETGRRTGG